MFKPLLCTAHQHDWRVVALALVVCAFSSATSMRLLLSANQFGKDLRTGLLLAAGACGGAGLWATHFIAMLSFDPGVPTAYDPFGTLASLVIALAGGAGSVLLMIKTPRRWRNLVWGLAFGSFAALMHYVGMAALRLPGHLSWTPALVVASVVFGTGFAILSRVVAFGATPSSGRFVLGTALLVIATCGLHFIGMIALTITFDPTVAAPANGIPHDVLALGVGGLTLAIGLVCLWTIWLGTRARVSALNRIHAMFEALPQAVAYFDAADGYVFGNDAFEAELTGLGIEPAAGLIYRDVLLRVQVKDAGVAEDEPAWVTGHLEARRQGRSILDHELADGRVLRVETRPISLGGSITVLSDITDLKKQAADLAAARDAAETADRAKSQFLANMSHELRTPMNGVIGVADLLAQETLTPRQGELVGLIQSSGSILDRLLRDLLDIAQIEAGVLEIVEAPLEVAGAAREVVQMFAAEALAKDIAIELHPAPLASAWAMGDVGRLKQILANLISNAVKFTERGRIDVAVATSGAMTVFTVADTGIGFDPAETERLFSRFEQADGSMTRRFGGVGLGLSIARDLAVRMGGTLSCDSTPGAGSVFFLTLPLRAAAAPTLAAPTASRAAARPQPVTETPSPAAGAEDPAEPQILVVDDVAANRKVLSLILDSAGIQTTCVDNGLEAVKAWRGGGVAAILMDIQMPVMDGLTAVRTIRQLEAAEKRSPTPIIMVSANAMAEHVKASLEAGANAHLAKPISAERLFAALQALDDAEPDAELEDAA
jgi:signal transduction histidine kinase/CheY-like chemotaxis protein